jgi:hypothetical protein
MGARCAISIGWLPEHASVPDGVVVRRRDACGETTKQRQRIHQGGDGAVGEGSLEDDADQAVLALLDLILRNGRAQHVCSSASRPEGSSAPARVAAWSVKPSMEAHSGLSYASALRSRGLSRIAH